MRTLREQIVRGSLLFPFQHYKMTNTDANLFIPYHWHEELEILYCIEGSLCLMINNQMYTLTKDDIFFINPKELHQFQSNDPTLIYYAYVFPLEKIQLSEQDYLQDRFIKPLLHASLLFPVYLEKQSACYPIIRQEIETIIYVNEMHSSAYQLMTKACLLKIIAALSAQKLFIEHTPSITQHHGQDSALRIREISDWLKAHLQESITLETAASHFHTSPKYFSRFFKQLFQKNFCEYVSLLRTEMACMLLLTTNKTIAEIAYQCGYANPSYFIKIFKQYTGMTPLHYRTAKLIPLSYDVSASSYPLQQDTAEQESGNS